MADCAKDYHGWLGRICLLLLRGLLSNAWVDGNLYCCTRDIGWRPEVDIVVKDCNLFSLTARPPSNEVMRWESDSTIRMSAIFDLLDKFGRYGRPRRNCLRRRAAKN